MVTGAGGMPVVHAIEPDADLPVGWEEIMLVSSVVEVLVSESVQQLSDDLKKALERVEQLENAAFGSGVRPHEAADGD